MRLVPKREEPKRWEPAPTRERLGRRDGRRRPEARGTPTLPTRERDREVSTREDAEVLPGDTPRLPGRVYVGRERVVPRVRPRAPRRTLGLRVGATREGLLDGTRCLVAGCVRRLGKEARERLGKEERTRLGNEARERLGKEERERLDEKPRLREEDTRLREGERALWPPRAPRWRLSPAWASGESKRISPSRAVA